MVIRQAKESDCAAMAQLRWDFKQEEHNTLTDKEEFLSSCTQFFCTSLEANLWSHWLAVETNKIVGISSLFRVDNIPTPEQKIRRWFYMTNLYTVPEKRRQGIATQLIQACCSQATQEQGELCIVWPDEQKTELYEKLEFKPNPYLFQRNLII